MTGKSITTYLGVIFLLALTSCSRNLNAKKPEDDFCIESFNEYLFEYSDYDNEQRTIYPLKPWGVESEIPFPVGYLEDLYVAGIRTVSGVEEIWIGIDEVPIYDDASLLNRFFVYKPTIDEWIEIDTSIDEYDLFIDQIYISSAGSIYGRNVFLDNKHKKNVPVISIFNEEMNIFEIVEETRGTSHGAYYSWPEWDTIHLSSNDVFWFFSYKDAIYSYDLESNQMERHISLKDYGDIRNLYSAPDGSIIFNSPSIGGTGDIIRFIPEENVLIPINQIKWSFIGASLIDNNGTIWLTSGYGYVKADGSKRIFHPNPIEYWWRMDFNAEWRYFHFPSPFFESSDGRIWFIDSVEILDDNYGMAWFDPDSNEGCWFTTEASNIMEGQNNNLWMMSFRSLYRLALEK